MHILHALVPAAALLAAAPLHAQNAAATGDAPMAAYRFPTCAAYRAADAEAQQAMRTDYVLRVDWEQNRIGTADPDLIEEACWAEGTLANFKARLDEQRNAPGYAETVRKNDAIRARNRAGRASDPCYIDEPEMRHVNEDILYSAYSPVSRTIDERKERDRASCMRAVAAASDGTIDDREMAALAGDLLAHVAALDMRSAMARRAGRFDEARAARLASIELLRANNGNLGNGLRDYAALLADIGRFVEAADVMEQAARAKKPGVGINDDYLFFRLEAADATLRAGAIDDAETIIRDTIPLVGGTFRFGSPDSANAHLLFGKALDALARVRLAQGRAADAERLLASFDWFYREALVRPVGKLPHYLPRIDVALALNDVAGAEAGAALLAALPQDDFSISEVRAVRLALARVALRGARPGAALAPLDALCGEGQAGDFAGRTQCDALRARAILAADPRSPAALAAAFEAMQAANRSVAGDALARNSALAAASLGGVSQLALDYEETMRAIRAADQDIDRLLASGEVADRQRQLSARRAELVARAAQIGDTLRVKAPRYWEFRAPRAVRLDELRGDGGLLADNEALVVLSAPVDGAAGLTFAVSRRDAAWAPIDVSADELARTVRTLRRQIDPSTDTPAGTARVYEAFDRGMAFDLHQALLGNPDVARVLDDTGIDTLLVVADGVLAAIPPGLLVTRPPTGADDDPAALRETAWLIRDKAIAILPATGALRTLRSKASAERPADNMLIAFANPDYKGTGQIPGLDPGIDPMSIAVTRSFTVPAAPTRGQVRAEGEDSRNQLAALPELRETLKEGVALTRLLGGRPEYLLLGPDASEARLRALSDKGVLARTRTLSFSTHGLLSGDFDGLAEPALALAAPAPGAPGDGLLLASEAATLKLAADLVVLSACNTAAPDQIGGEGLSGLARSFFYAGADHLLVSHWQVRDDATRALISATFDHLAKDGARGNARALQAAMIELIDDPRDDEVRLIVGQCATSGMLGVDDCPMASLAHPWAWAPFVMVGLP